VGYVTLPLPRDVPCRNKPENETAVAHPAITERRRRSRPRKVQLTLLTKSALLQQPGREADTGQHLMRTSNSAPLLEVPACAATAPSRLYKFWRSVSRIFDIGGLGGGGEVTPSLIYNLDHSVTTNAEF
jgi:hypothetical protein